VVSADIGVGAVIGGVRFCVRHPAGRRAARRTWPASRPSHAGCTPY